MHTLSKEMYEESILRVEVFQLLILKCRVEFQWKVSLNFTEQYELLVTICVW